MGWITRLRRWIKRLFRPQKRTPHPRILQRWYGKHCAVLRIERNTPGEQATYRITSLQGDYDYLLTLDYLPELQAELVGQVNGTRFRLRPHNDPHNDAITHRFSVWRVWRNGSSHPIGIWDCDLQGISPPYALREIAPRRAIAGVALRILKIQHNLKTPDLSWQSQCDRIDWLGLLTEKIRQELQNPHHNLKACMIVKGNLA